VRQSDWKTRTEYPTLQLGSTTPSIGRKVDGKIYNQRAALGSSKLELVIIKENVIAVFDQELDSLIFGLGVCHFT